MPCTKAKCCSNELRRGSRKLPLPSCIAVLLAAVYFPYGISYDEKRAKRGVFV